VRSDAGSACSRPIGSSLALIISRLPMSFSIRTARFRMGRKRAGAWITSYADPVRVNTRGFRWCDGIPQDPTEHQRLYFIELHGYF
jgi:hypothetical protein